MTIFNYKNKCCKQLEQKKVDGVNGVILVSMLLPELWSLNYPKKCIFCSFVLTSARNLSVFKQFTYMDLKVFITVFQKILCLIRNWATVHEILAIKISKKDCQNPNIRSNSLCRSGLFWTFWCRLINKSVLKWFLLIMKIPRFCGWGFSKAGILNCGFPRFSILGPLLF